MADYLYIHIPFCVKKCVYCDFFSVSYDESTVKAYVDALCKELSLKKHPGGALKTVYFGGGTPTLLPAECFTTLFGYLRDNFAISPDAEITVEANPGTIDESKIETLLSLGVNRLSVGVQSFKDKELATLGRIHSSDEALKSIVSIKKAGLKNFSIDLMYGIPGQTTESWRKSLTKAVELSPTHISAYELTIEESTPLSLLITSGIISMLNEELILDMYNNAIDYLAGHGYEHYEISNFALPGFKCSHNLNYWNRGEYIDAGAGAHAFVNGVRTKNIADVNKYIDSLNIGIIPETESFMVTPVESLKEIIFLGLRKTEGINAKDNPSSTIYDREALKKLVDASGEMICEGYLELNEDYLRLTKKGIVISNTIIVKLFEKLGL
ncbi:MAG: radical SAM family heme chaperone HemW [Thermodesulfovibrionales bacterium]|jgi:oxygen-independent coproporphyrinogen-3 oxidase